MEPAARRDRHRSRIVIKHRGGRAPIDHECVLQGVVAELCNQLEKLKH